MPEQELDKDPGSSCIGEYILNEESAKGSPESELEEDQDDELIKILHCICTIKINSFY